MSVDLNQLTFGLDPEFFAVYPENNTLKCIPPVAFKMDLGVRPVKIDPTPAPRNHDVYLDDKDFHWIHDGVAFELGVKRPLKNAKEMFDIVEHAKSNLINFLNQFGYMFYDRPSVEFDLKKYYDGRPEEFQNCVIFGCDGDLDAIQSRYICKIIDARKWPIRYGGGHFHLGSENKEHVEEIHKNIYSLIKLMACTLGIASISMTPYIEEEKKRAKYYGKPGRFRYQPHGAEYRSPSNSWVRDRNSIETMIECTKKAFYLFMNPKDGKDFLRRYLKDSVKAIRYSDKVLATELLKETMK